MPATSLIKFRDRTDGGPRGRLYWGRAGLDGLPFRGHQAPMLTQEEYDERVTQVRDAKNGTFRTWVPEENQAYLEILDSIANGWAAASYVDRWRDAKTDRHVVYLEWLEYYLEDGSPIPIPGITGGTSHGQANFAADHPAGPFAVPPQR